MILNPLFEVGKSIIERVWPDPSAQAEAQMKLLQMQQAGEFKALEAALQINLAQTQVNQAEAQSPDNFRAGWRPAVGWVCVLGLAYQLVVRPCLNGGMAVLGYGVALMPELDTNTLMTLLTGLLGLAGMRSFEKIKDKA